MDLKLHSEKMGDVVVIRCAGRIGAGAGVTSLQHELDKQTKIPDTDFLAVKKVVLQLAEASYIDSSGLGALVHLRGVLMATGGEVKLAELSPAVNNVLHVTHLATLFHIYATEQEAVDAFSKGGRPHHKHGEPTKHKVVCVAVSKELLAYVDALMRRAGYDVFSSRRLGEAVALVKTIKPPVVICGPGLRELSTAESAFEQFRKSGPNVHVVELPADFSTAEAGQAGVDLVKQIHDLLN